MRIDRHFITAITLRNENPPHNDKVLAHSKQNSHKSVVYLKQHSQKPPKKKC